MKRAPAPSFGPLFSPGIVGKNHPRTSKAAAISVASITGHSRKLVYDFIVESGGCTDEQLLEGTGLPPSSGRPRRIELVRDGLVRDSGRTRKTASGREAVVWEAVTKEST